MAIRKTKKKKKKINKKSGGGYNLNAQLIRLMAGLIILILIVGAAGFIADYYLKSSQIDQQLSNKPPQYKSPRHQVLVLPESPRYEVFPVDKDVDNKSVSLPLIKKPEIKRPKELPMVAIIIDDIGYDRKIADQLLSLDAKITFSVLPYSTFAKQIIDSAHKKGVEIMLHLPMEPVEYPKINPGKGALLNAMSPDQLISMLNDDLNAIPLIRGVNNHMGSRMTTESEKINQIFSILKKRGLFFIDSITTSDTLCRSSARLFKLPFAQRDVFIDHEQDPAFIRKQIKNLIRIAIKKGEAVGIAHPHFETYKVLLEMMPDIKNKVKLVPASAIVHIIG